MTRRLTRLRNEIVTWADGSGTWHAKIILGVKAPSDLLNSDNLRRVARRAIRREVEARGTVGNGYRFRVEVSDNYVDSMNRFHWIEFREVGV